MERTRTRRRRQTRCQKCGELAPNWDIATSISERGSRELCTRCLNREVAEKHGLAGFEEVRFEPVRIAGCTGKVHEFHFRTLLFGPGVALDAFELRDGEPAGYQFEVISKPLEDPLVRLGRLIEKIRRALSRQHLEEGEFGLLMIADHNTVRGRIEGDEARDSEVPLLVIDGRPITWECLGRMLTMYEGFQFRLEIRDPSEEV